jgi:hypothetical protein
MEAGNHLNLTQNRIQTITNDPFLDFKSFHVLDLIHRIDIHLDTLQACFASINFVDEGVYLYAEDSCLRTLESLQNSEVVVYNLGLSRGSYNVQ